MLSDRRRLVLQALVEEYIASGQPVASKHLVERHRLGCSPATVRNELSALEETGYVHQPHVSSGRVPTDLGYRAFVDDLLDRESLAARSGTPGARPAPLVLASEVDQLMRQTSALLSNLTHYVAVVTAPTLGVARIRRVDLLSMGPRRVLVVVITESGQVVNRHVDLAAEVSPERLAEVERALGAALVDKRAAEVRTLRAAADDGSPQGRLLAEVMGSVLSCLEEADRDRLYHVGTPELLGLPEFADASLARPLLAMLEDGLALLETLSDLMRTGGLTVRIGSENHVSELGQMSVVAARYGPGDADGVVGVIGPTRMDYSRSIAAVHSVAEGLSEMLTAPTTEET